MSAKTVPPVDLDRAVSLYSLFDPEHQPLLEEFLRCALSADPESRMACASLTKALGQQSVEPSILVGIYLENSRKAADTLRKTMLSSLSLEDLGQRVDALSGGILWGLAESLAYWSRERLQQDRRSGLETARLAVRTARRAPLLPNLLSSKERQHLEGLCLAFVANALRAADETQAARETFDRAERPFGGADPLGFLPEILTLRASLEVFERSYHHALRTLNDALANSSDPAQRARIFLKRSIVWSHSMQEDMALREVEEAAAELQGSPDSELHYYVHQGRMDLLSRIGRFDEARDLLPQVREHLSRMDSAYETLQVRWVEARIVSQDQAVEGEALYRSVREGFLELGLPYRAAVATVELCRHLFTQGRFQEVAQLAAESVVEFRRQGIEQEVVGAIALLEDVHRSRLSLEIVTQILLRVQRAAHHRG